MTFSELLKAILYGLVEGITEWLPVSSTGHLILLERVLPLPVSAAFSETFDVVVQLGAILAVVVLYARRLNPISPQKSPRERRDTWRLWLGVGVGVIPSAVAGALLDGWLETHLFNSTTVAVTLILYGILFIILEKRRPPTALCLRREAPPLSTAFAVGLFQTLALVPGTSRSGATVLGGMLLGLPRRDAAEFSFFLAIPTMLGASLLKVAKLAAAGVIPTPREWGILAVGCGTAFLVSLCAIRFLTDFVKRHSFAPFGWYRMGLGLLVLLLL